MRAHPHDTFRRALRAFGLQFPGTETKSPWPEHLDLVVAGKTFVFLNVDGIALRLSCKLPSSAEMALGLPFCSPTPYGLGRSGWVTAIFADKEKPPLEVLKEWILESYRAQAPKRLVQALTESTADQPPNRPRVPPSAQKKKMSAVERTASLPRNARKTLTKKTPLKAASKTSRTVRRTSNKKGQKK